VRRVSVMASDQKAAYEAVVALIHRKATEIA